MFWEVTKWSWEVESGNLNPEIELEPEHRNNQRSEHVHQVVEPSIFVTLLPCEGIIL